MIHYYRYLFVKMKVFNYSELHFSGSDFLQNPYFSNSLETTYVLSKLNSLLQGTEYVWITGGRNFRANDLKTTEWIGAGQEGGRSIIGPDLPKAMNSQCMVSYKNTVLIIGGNTPGRTNSVLVYKFRDLNDFRYL